MQFNKRVSYCFTDKEHHPYTGEFYIEDGQTWYLVIDENGNPYETREEPVEIIDLTAATLVQVLIPDNPIIYNRPRPDGTYPSLDKFFNKES